MLFIRRNKKNEGYSDTDLIYNIAYEFGLINIEKTMWNEMINNGIINPYTTLSQVNMTKKQKVEGVHKFKISLLSDGRLGTWVPDDNCKNGRRNIKANDEVEMISKLYQIYFGEEESRIRNLRLCDIFEEWLEYKCKKKNNKPETQKQNKASYKKYVENSKIASMKLQNIKTIDLEEWAIDTLITHKMTAKQFNNHKIVVTGSLAYAKRKQYISENPWVKEELEYAHLFKSSRIKTSAKMIFYPDEIEILCNELERGYQLNGNIANLGLMMNFDMGLRIGELCAIKWSDINWDNETIFIQRQEDSSGEVEEYVKSDSEAGYRELVLSDTAIIILKRIKHERTMLSGYIFVNPDGQRANKMQFGHRLTKAELAIGWKTGELKYSHCIRRTVASRMSVSGFSLEEIRKWLGHTHKETTLKYIYNPFRESETKNKVKKTAILSTNKSCLQLSSKNEPIFLQRKMPEAL